MAAHLEIRNEKFDYKNHSKLSKSKKNSSFHKSCQMSTANLT